MNDIDNFSVGDLVELKKHCSDNPTHNFRCIKTNLPSGTTDGSGELVFNMEYLRRLDPDGVTRVHKEIVFASSVPLINGTVDGYVDKKMNYNVVDKGATRVAQCGMVVPNVEVKSYIQLLNANGDTLPRFEFVPGELANTPDPGLRFLQNYPDPSFGVPTGPSDSEEETTVTLLEERPYWWLVRSEAILPDLRHQEEGQPLAFQTLKLN